MRAALRIAALALGACALGDARAATTAYTDRASFDAAITALAPVAALDFDALAPNTIVPSGAALGAFAFTYAIDGGAQLMVIDGFATTSPANSLGVVGDLAFLAGDGFELAFPPARAIGLYVIGEDLAAGDVSLGAFGTSVALGETPDAILSDGSAAYWLGLVESDPAGATTSAALASAIVEDVGDYVWNVDDLVAAPEPGAASGAAAGALAVGALASLTRLRNALRRRARSASRPGR
ncbi:MAG: hypothetical protein DCC71_07855 [Proteobacteria bacterium]|nr:MAG: hypothetical protein DCC71_07855 [Pseudomonadota bacterium]